MSNPAPALIPVLTGLLAVSVFAPAALAATPVNETRPLDARGHLHVENLKGRIEVRAWDRNEVRVTGRLGQGVEKLDISGDARRLSIKVRYPKTSERGFFSGNDRSEPSQLQLMVPLQANLDIDSVSADVDIAGVAPAELAIDSVSGDISAVGAPRQARIDSVSGDQKLVLNSQLVDTESVSGDIHLRGRLGGQVSVDSVSGDIDVAAALLHRPSVVFLDEPTIGLDVTMQRRIRTFITEYNRRFGATVLLTSHYMADVEALCKRVVVIHHGRLVFDGDLSVLVKQFTEHKTIVVQLADCEAVL